MHDTWHMIHDTRYTIRDEVNILEIFAKYTCAFRSKARAVPWRTRKQTQSTSHYRSTRGKSDYAILFLKKHKRWECFFVTKIKIIASDNSPKNDFGYHLPSEPTSSPFQPSKAMRLGGARAILRRVHHSLFETGSPGFWNNYTMGTRFHAAMLGSTYRCHLQWHGLPPTARDCARKHRRQIKRCMTRELAQCTVMIQYRSRLFFFSCLYLTQKLWWLSE